MVIRKVEIESICLERRSMSHIIAGEKNNKICVEGEKKRELPQVSLI